MTLIYLNGKPLRVPRHTYVPASMLRALLAIEDDELLFIREGAGLPDTFVDPDKRIDVRYRDSLYTTKKAAEEA